MLTESYKMAGRTDKEGVIKALEREIAKAAGTQFTGFTSIKVQTLAPAARRARGVAHAGRD
jgi:hypothetical protein